MVSLTPNPSYSVTLRIKLPNRVSRLAAVLEAIARAGGNLGNIDVVEKSRERSEEHTSELQSLTNLVCRLLLEKKKKKKQRIIPASQQSPTYQ